MRFQLPAGNKYFGFLFRLPLPVRPLGVFFSTGNRKKGKTVKKGKQTETGKTEKRKRKKGNNGKPNIKQELGCAGKHESPEHNKLQHGSETGKWTKTQKQEDGIKGSPVDQKTKTRENGDGKTESRQTTGLDSTGKLITGTNGAGFCSSLTAGNPYRN